MDVSPVDTVTVFNILQSTVESIHVVLPNLITYKNTLII